VLGIGKVRKAWGDFHGGHVLVLERRRLDSDEGRVAMDAVGRLVVCSITDELRGSRSHFQFRQVSVNMMGWPATSPRNAALFN